VSQLPAESATVRAAVGPSAAWTVEAHLLALVHDAVAAGNWQRAGKSSAPKPKPIPRPGVGDKGRRKVRGSSFEIADFDRVYQSALEKAADRWTTDPESG